MGTIPITGVLYSNALAQIRSIEHDSGLPGAKFAFIVRHLAKTAAAQKCYVTRKNLYSSACRSHTDCMDVTNTTIASDIKATLIYMLKTFKLFYNMLQNRYYM